MSSRIMDSVVGIGAVALSANALAIAALRERYASEPWFVGVRGGHDGLVIEYDPAHPPPSVPADHNGIRLSLARGKPRTTHVEVARVSRSQWLVARAREAGVPIDDEDMRAVVLDDNAAVTGPMACAREVFAKPGAAISFLVGSKGLGKSCGAVHAAMRAEGSVCYVAAWRVASTPDNGHPTNAEAWARWRTARNLVLDDVGVESLAQSEVVTRFLFERYWSALATAATTNLLIAQIAERYLSGPVGDMLRDRLFYGQGKAVQTGKEVRFNGLRPWFSFSGDSLRNPVEREKLRARK